MFSLVSSLADTVSYVVEFDVDTGPTVDGLYPQLTLRPAERETLYISHFSFGSTSF